MPIRGYFEPRPFAWMTSVKIPAGLGGNGIRVEGPVLEGRMSVDDALVLDWIRGGQAEERKSGPGNRSRGEEVARAGTAQGTP